MDEQATSRGADGTRQMRTALALCAVGTACLVPLLACWSAGLPRKGPSLSVPAGLTVPSIMLFWLGLVTIVAAFARLGWYLFRRDFLPSLCHKASGEDGSPEDGG